MALTIDYYFAPNSPWTYLGHERFAQIAAAVDADDAEEAARWQDVDIAPFASPLRAPHVGNDDAPTYLELKVVAKKSRLSPLRGFLRSVSNDEGSQDRGYMIVSLDRSDLPVLEFATEGETPVEKLMKKTNAIIGGEGNGGIIYPELHYGRDALVGIALFLTHLAKSNQSVSVLRSTYPSYFISKNKVILTSDMDIDALLVEIKKRYKKQPHNTIDGLKIEFENDWVHLRKSNTEPIIRIYAEGSSETVAENLAKKIIGDIKEYCVEAEKLLPR